MPAAIDPGSWEPTTTQQMLRQRAQLLAYLRDFFHQREVLEVETPLLGAHTVTELHIDSMAVRERWLQTSPEYCMKRLLAAGSGPIFQICKAFRHGEAGSRHNPEFSLLEWYRPGFSLEQLIQEVAELVSGWLSPEQPGNWESLTYRELFQQELDVDPLTAEVGELRALAESRLDLSIEGGDRDDWLDLLMSHLLEPVLAARGLVFVYNYPASQAALARLGEETGQSVARRFELYARGVELANGYFELCDPREQRSRFEQDNRRRRARGKPELKMDNRLLNALEAGLPECCGVALGIDRLLMLSSGSARLEQVLSFPWSRA